MDATNLGYQMDPSNAEAGWRHGFDTGFSRPSSYYRDQPTRTQLRSTKRILPIARNSTHDQSVTTGSRTTTEPPINIKHDSSAQGQLIDPLMLSVFNSDAGMSEVDISNSDSSYLL
jgi:hypothetical protein